MKRHACVALLLAALAGPVAADSYDALNAGIQLRNNYDSKGAIPFFDKALAANDLVPGLQFVAHFDRGQARGETGDAQGALEDYNAALALRPGDAMTLYARSMVFRALKRNADALADLDVLVAAYPENARFRMERALLYTQDGKDNEALQDVQVLREIKSANRNLTMGTLECMPDFAHIVARVQVDGKDIDAMLDTGSDATFITMQAAKYFLGLDDKNPLLKSLGKRNINGMTGEVFYYPSTPLNLGGLTVSNPRIIVLPDKIWPRQDKLLLGQGTLRKLHMYIAYKEKNLYVTPAMAGR